jgi:uncharacterized phiE125 gp8 family phage protein
MWFPAITTVAPMDGLGIVAFDQATAFLRADSTDEQEDVIAAVLAAAQGHVEAYTSSRLLTQTVEARAGEFRDLMHLPFGPVQSIVSIQYSDTAGGVQTLDPETYELFGAGIDRGVRPAFGQQWPPTRNVEDAVKVTAVVGYGSGADVPTPIVQAVLLLLGDYYTSREDTVVERSVTPAALPNGVQSLLCNYRIYG